MVPKSASALVHTVADFGTTPADTALE